MLQEESRSQSWIDQHWRIVDENKKTSAEIAIYGDSIVKRFGEKGHLDVWEKEVGKDVVLFGIGGDRIEHLLWRIIYGRIPQSVNMIIVHIGTNSIQHASAYDVAEGMVNICQKLHERKRCADIILTGILPGKDRPLWKVVSVL